MHLEEGPLRLECPALCLQFNLLIESENSLERAPQAKDDARQRVVGRKGFQSDPRHAFGFDLDGLLQPAFAEHFRRSTYRLHFPPP